MTSETKTKAKNTDTRKDNWPKGLLIRKESYRYRRNVKGKKYIEVWGAMSEAKAIAQADVYNYEIGEGIDPIRKNEIAKATVKNFIAKTWLPKKTVETGEKTVKRYRSIMNNFLVFIATKRLTLISEIDYNIAADYVVHRQTIPVMPNGSSIINNKAKIGISLHTMGDEVAVLKQMFEEAVSRNLITDNPFVKIKIKKPNNDDIRAARHPLDEIGEVALLKAAKEFDEDIQEGREYDKKTITLNAKLADIFLFLIKTGCREDEMVHLQWLDIDWPANLINVKKKSIIETRVINIYESAFNTVASCTRGKDPDDTLFKEKDLEQIGRKLDIRGKKDLLSIKVSGVDLKKRTITITTMYAWEPKQTHGQVPMCQTVINLLKKLYEKKSSNYVFAHHDGGRCRHKLLRHLKKIQKNAGIVGRLRLHDLRHTCAVRLRERGVPLETIMGIMRHADIKETLIYAPYDVKEGREMIKVLDDY